MIYIYIYMYNHAPHCPSSQSHLASTQEGGSVPQSPAQDRNGVLAPEHVADTAMMKKTMNDWRSWSGHLVLWWRIPSWKSLLLIVLERCFLLLNECPALGCQSLKIFFALPSGPCWSRRQPASPLQSQRQRPKRSVSLLLASGPGVNTRMISKNQLERPAAERPERTSDFRKGFDQFKFELHDSNSCANYCMGFLSGCWGRFLYNASLKQRSQFFCHVSILASHVFK